MRRSIELGRDFSRSVALCAALAVGAPLLVAGCNMLNLGQGDSSASSTTGGKTEPSNANLGDFTLTLKMTQSTCGQGAAGLLDKWSFDVSLAHTGDTATWTSGGATIDGQFDPTTRELDFSSSVTVDMRKDDPASPTPKPACSMKRSDEAFFTLDAVDHPKSLAGELTYSFAPTMNSNCADLVYGQTPSFKAIPCTVTYAVTGVSKSAPSK